jgi:indole-3-glycerol phosphate synthase
MILNDILVQRRKDLEELKSRFPLSKLREAVLQKGKTNPRSFKKALNSASKSFHLICELKKASPSEGVIREDFQPLRLAAQFEFAGASAISVLTEPHFFKGRPSYLKTVRQVTHIPLLRKDFLFESYQIYEAALLEADAFLLIASILTEDELANLIKLGKDLQMDALVEVHTDDDLKKALGAGAEIIGINNRDLKTLTVDVHRAQALIPHIPKGITIVVESGLSRHEDLLSYKSLGIHAFLIGTVLMKSQDIPAKIQELLGEDKKWRKTGT